MRSLAWAAAALLWTLAWPSMLISVLGAVVASGRLGLDGATFGLGLATGLALAVFVGIWRVRS